MVERRMIRKSGFQPGNTHSRGNAGNNAVRRMTGRFISKEWYEALIDLDPVQQIPVIRRLVKAAIKHALGDGKEALKLLIEVANRLEGQAVQQIAFADMTAQSERKTKLITHDMSDQEALEIVQGMLGHEGKQRIYEDDDLAALPAPAPEPIKPKPAPVAASLAAKEDEDEDEEDEPQPRFADGGRKRSRYAAAAARARRGY
jgi:hypothetical protein